MSRLPAALLALALLAAPAVAAETTLRLFAMGMEAELLPQLLAGFERENPGVRVKVQASSWGGAFEKLVAMALSGRPPDVAQLGTTWMNKFVCMDALAEAGPMLDAASAVAADDLFAGSRATATFAGRLYGVPWYVDTRIMLYRRDALERAGFAAPPATWEEFLDFGRRTMADRRDGLPRLFCDLGGDPFAWFYWQAGGEFRPDDAAGPCFAPVPFLAAADHLLTFYREGLVPVSDPGGGLDYVTEFVRGHYVATFTGPWMVSDLDRKFPEDRADRIAAPFPGKRNRASFIGGSNLVVFRAARRPELSWRLVEYLARPDVQARWYAISNDLPANRRAWDLPELAGDETLAAFRAALEETRFPPDTPEWEVVGNELGREIERMIRGVATPSGALVRLNALAASLHAAKRAPVAPGFTLALGALLVALPFAAALGWLFAAPARGRGRLRRALPFLLPAGALLVVFRLCPIAASFATSLTDWNMYGVADLANVHFIGLENYRKLLADPLFHASVRNTLVFVLVGAPLNLAFALALALPLDRYEGRLKGALRAAFFTPAVVTTVAAAVVFQWIYSDASPVNRTAAALGLPAVPWLTDPSFALPSLILFSVWKGFGYNMILFLAALRNVPQELYEAVRVDGGGPLAEVRHVALPFLRRTLFVAFVGTLVGNLHFFVEPFILTGGGPLDSTLSVMFYTYRQGFTHYNLGYASAIIHFVFFCFCLFNLWQGRMRRRLEE